MATKKGKGNERNVSLTPELQKYVEDKVKSGEYYTKSEVVREALRLLIDYDKLRQFRVEELRREIQIGLKAAERGELLDGPTVFKELRERIARRANKRL